MWLLTLKHLLMRPLALEPLRASQMSTHITAMSDFSEALMTLSQDTRAISLKI